MKPFVLLALVAGVTGCSSGEASPPSLDEVEADFGYPPRGYARVSISGEQLKSYNATFGKIPTGGCGLLMTFVSEKDEADRGNILFGDRGCSDDMETQVGYGGSLAFNVYASYTPQRHRVLNDSTLQGVMSGTLAPVGLFGRSLHVSLTYTAARTTAPR